MREGWQDGGFGDARVSAINHKAGGPPIRHQAKFANRRVCVVQRMASERATAPDQASDGRADGSGTNGERDKRFAALCHTGSAEDGAGMGKAAHLGLAAQGWHACRSLADAGPRLGLCVRGW